MEALSSCHVSLILVTYKLSLSVIIVAQVISLILKNCLSIDIFHGNDLLNLAERDDVLLPRCTKSSVLSFFARTFDPLGSYLPITVRGKVLLRRFCLAKKSWDDVLPDELCSA